MLSMRHEENMDEKLCTYLLVGLELLHRSCKVEVISLLIQHSQKPLTPVSKRCGELSNTQVTKWDWNIT